MRFTFVKSQARLFRCARAANRPSAHIHIELLVALFSGRVRPSSHFVGNGYVVWLIAGRCDPSVWRLDWCAGG